MNDKKIKDKSKNDDNIIIDTDNSNANKLNKEVNILDKLIELFKSKEFDQGITTIEQNEVILYLPNF